MHVYVDADACPVKSEIVKVCRRRAIPVTMLCDTSHQISDGYSEVITVDKGADSADLRLINLVCPGDVVVTQDYGVAAMALGRKAYAIDQNGREYEEGNMDMLLFDRHIGQKARKVGKYGGKSKKRTPGDNRRFEEKFDNLLNRIDIGKK